MAMLLEFIDSKFKITEKVIAALDELSEKGIARIIQEKKQAFIDKGNNITNNVVDSVIEYAIEKAENALYNLIEQLFRRTRSLSI